MHKEKKMLCLPNSDICIDYGWLCALGVLAIFVIGGLIKFGMSQNQTSDEGISHRVADDHTSGAPVEEETPTVKVGQKFLFDTIEDMTCHFLVTEVHEDDSEVNGKFVVQLPVGATNIDPRYDSDNEEVTVEYDLGPNHGLEVYFNASGPENENDLDGYSWIVDGAEAEAKSA